MSETKSKKETAKSAGTDVKQTKAVKADVKNTKTSTKEVKAVAKDNAEGVSPALDKLLWFISFVLIALAIGGNFYYIRFLAVDEGSLARLGRVAAVIVVILAGLGVTLFTNKGKKLLSFTRESYIELRKVVWPTRQEAMQTTLIVFVAVVLVSLFLYLCDIVFLQLVRAITL